jgi:alkanesulfonate monooxygenase SsuD/methylene tetrahydromethanopterin reductase-like flavin-dependent oxidoreductase (luciferase family)
MIFGGRSDQAVARTVKYGIGYTMGGGTPESLIAVIERVKKAWREAGRKGEPEFRALGYFAIGEGAQEEAQANLMDYYGEYGAAVWKGALRSAAEARDRIKTYAEAGCDELLLFMSAPAVEQVERLAEAVL